MDLVELTVKRLVASNEARFCVNRNRSFEVPKGYPPLVGWKCARYVQGLQQCPVEYVSPSLPCRAAAIAGRCFVCGCIK